MHTWCAMPWRCRDSGIVRGEACSRMGYLPVCGMVAVSVPDSVSGRLHDRGVDAAGPGRGSRHRVPRPRAAGLSMRRHRVLYHEWIAAVGIALLAGVFAASVNGTDHPPVDPVASQLKALPDGEGRISPLSDDARAVIVEGGRERLVRARLRFVLPPMQPGESPWVVWMGREPIDALALRSSGWRSQERDFFAPKTDETLLPAGFMFHLPSNWEGRRMELRARAKSAACWSRRFCASRKPCVSSSCDRHRRHGLFSRSCWR